MKKPPRNAPLHCRDRFAVVLRSSEMSMCVVDMSRMGQLDGEI
jgi:hypothetical protein